MCKKCFLTLIGLLFTAKVVFILAYWVINGQMVVFMSGWLAPIWLFYVGIIVDTILAVWAFKLVACCSHECKNGKKRK